MGMLHAGRHGCNPGGDGAARTLIETLGPSRSCKVRVVEWKPLPDSSGPLGIATIICRRTAGATPKIVSYKVTPVRPSADWQGMGFLFEKLDGTESRAVFIADDGRHSCDCEAGCYASKEKADRRHRLIGRGPVGDGSHCKHIDAIIALKRNDWLRRFLDRPAASEPEFTVEDLDAAFEAAVAERIGGFDVCPDCGELGTFADDATGKRVCVMCPLGLLVTA